jgi:hypothetical protein
VLRIEIKEGRSLEVLFTCMAWQKFLEFLEDSPPNLELLVSVWYVRYGRTSDQQCNNKELFSLEVIQMHSKVETRSERFLGFYEGKF